jgi:hypothetical protein
MITTIISSDDTAQSAKRLSHILLIISVHLFIYLKKSNIVSYFSYYAVSKKAEAFEVDVGAPVKATRAPPMLNSTLRARNKEESAKSKEDAVATKPVRVPLKTSNKSAAK